MNPFASLLSNTLTKKEDITDAFRIHDFQSFAGKIDDRLIPSYRVLATTEDGEPLRFLIGRNQQRDEFVRAFKALLAQGHQPPLMRLTKREITSKTVGETEMWDFEMAE